MLKTNKVIVILQALMLCIQILPNYQKVGEKVSNMNHCSFGFHELADRFVATVSVSNLTHNLSDHFVRASRIVAIHVHPILFICHSIFAIENLLIDLKVK